MSESRSKSRPPIGTADAKAMGSRSSQRAMPRRALATTAVIATGVAIFQSMFKSWLWRRLGRRQGTRIVQSIAADYGDVQACRLAQASTLKKVLSEHRGRTPPGRP